MRAALAAIGLAAIAIAPLPARAADIVEIEVRNVEFRPAGASAAAGDTIRFTTTSGSHNLETYDGSMPDGGFMSAGQTVDVTFPGETSTYYCTFHAVLDGADCQGMCGVITSTPPAIPAPVITSPADGSTITTPGATVSGTAEAPATRVKIYDGNNFLGDTEISGGTFSRGFNFGSGAHTLTAISLDGDGFESPASAPVTFTVDLPDNQAPTVVLNEPSMLVDINPLGVSGIAADDTLLVSVAVEIRNALTGEVIEPAVTCPTCGTASSTFHAQTAVPIGVHDVVAIARDGAGRTGEATRRVVVLG